MQNLHKWEMLLLKLFDTIGSSINNGKLKCNFLNAIIDPFSIINLLGAGQKHWKHLIVYWPKKCQIKFHMG